METVFDHNTGIPLPENLPEASKGDSRDIAARKLGMSGKTLEKGIEQWIKTTIGEWIATDGLESVIIMSFQDTEFRNVIGIVSEAVLEAFDNCITTENSVEAEILYDLLMESALKHAQKTFQAVMGELRLVYYTMLTGITRALA